MTVQYNNVNIDSLGELNGVGWIMGEACNKTYTSDT